MASPVLSVCHKAALPFAARPKNSRFLRSSRVFKALPLDASPGLLNASRDSQTSRANSRRALQTLRKASSPQGIQGGGLGRNTRALQAESHLRFQHPSQPKLELKDEHFAPQIEKVAACPLGCWCVRQRHAACSVQLSRRFPRWIGT